jgi:hypothetical protein
MSDHRYPKRLDAAIAAAADFVRGRLRAGAYGLSGLDDSGAAKITHQAGHLFVVAFIVEAMAGLIDEVDRTIILMRILSEEDDGQWGYQPPAPRHLPQFVVYHVDADDTAYAIRTLRRLGVNRPPKGLLPYYREDSRLFVTFNTPGPATLTTEASPQNNLLAHPEVNSNVFLALRGTHFDHLINYDMIVDTQEAAGFWRSYYYPSRLYATGLNLDLLHGMPEYAPVAARALAYIAGSQAPDGSWGGDAGETALAVAALALYGSHPDALGRGVDWLLAAMAPEGSWTSDAAIWEFHRGPNEVWRARDIHRTYTSARCLTALRRAVDRIG